MPTLTPTDRIVLVTGPSGAGRATALNVLEDLGFEAIDNLPLRLIPRLFDGEPLNHPLALGIDVRTRDFSLSALMDLHKRLVAQVDGRATLLFLDCRHDVLLRRYSETRRRHPLTPMDTPDEGISQEITLLEPLRETADIVIDTSDLSPHDLKSALHGWFANKTDQQLAVSVQSFSYKRGIPHGVDIVFDCRFLANPHWDADLRAKTGLDAEVQAYIEKDPRLAPFLDQITAMLQFLLPEFEREGKTHVSVGLGCTGGQHRSVAVTEAIARTLADAGWRVSIKHIELSRKGLADSQTDLNGQVGKVSE